MSSYRKLYSAKPQQATGLALEDADLHPVRVNSTKLRAFFCLLAVLSSGLEATQPDSPPNVIIILVDDMGYSDPGCYGGEIATPNLDRLAAHGLRYTQFYNTGRCWPTRSSLLTGYYAQSIGMDPVVGGHNPSWLKTIPQYLREAGYKSYHSGKWHYRNKPRPVADGGFDRSYWMEDYNQLFWDYEHYLDDEPLPPPGIEDSKYAAISITDHAMEFLAQHHKESPDAPFFLYLAYNTPHFPLKAPPEDIEKYLGTYSQGWDLLKYERWQRMRAEGLVEHSYPPMEPGITLSRDWEHMTLEEMLRLLGPGEKIHSAPWESLTDEQKAFQSTKMAIHAAMVDRIDQEIGRVVALLEKRHILEDTVIFFLSDNGASAEIMIRGKGHDPAAEPGSEGSYICLGPGFAHAANTPFRRYKHWVQEGGIATPLIVHWPSGIRGGGDVRTDPGHVVDFLPTLLDLAGVDLETTMDPESPQAPHGLSLKPSFYADNVLEREYLYWYHQGNRALRMGDWKIVSARIDEDEWSLYNLARDRGEQVDLKERNPDLFRTMVEKWEGLEEGFREMGDPSLVGDNPDFNKTEGLPKTVNRG